MVKIPTATPTAMKMCIRDRVHHVHHADLQLRQLLPQNADSGQRFQSGGIAAAGHHHIRLLAGIIGGPLPDADALGAVLDRLLHGEPLGAGMLAGHDDVHIVPALDAVVEAGKQAVGIGGQIHPHHVRLLVGHIDVYKRQVQGTGGLLSIT